MPKLALMVVHAPFWHRIRMMCSMKSCNLIQVKSALKMQCRMRHFKRHQWPVVQWQLQLKPADLYLGPSSVRMHVCKIMYDAEASSLATLHVCISERFGDVRSQRRRSMHAPSFAHLRTRQPRFVPPNCSVCVPVAASRSNFAHRLDTCLECTLAAVQCRCESSRDIK